MSVALSVLVMHGLDTYIQGRCPRIISEGAVWMPGSRLLEAGHDRRAAEAAQLCNFWAPP